MEFAVTRDATTLVTLHGGSATTACDEASEELGLNLEALAEDEVVSEWSIDDTEVYEYPAAPFDPYTITVAFTVSVVVEADDAEEATEIGAGAIEAALEDANVEGVTYTSSPSASAA